MLAPVTLRPVDCLRGPSYRVRLSHAVGSGGMYAVVIFNSYKYSRTHLDAVIVFVVD